MELKLINNMIAIVDSSIIYPKALEIQAIDNSGMYKNQQVGNLKETLGIRLSKIGLTVKPVFYVSDNRIHFKLEVNKNLMKYYAETIDGEILDYVIIEHTCYFLSGAYSLLSDLLKKHNIKVENTLSYIDFMTITRFCKENNIFYEEDVINKIQNFENTEQDINLNAHLFDYQKKGYNWLKFMCKNECGCILADEMGLGKTLQIIALLGNLRQYNNQSHFLVVAPVSLLENWKREIIKFYPSLSVLVHHGTNRTGMYKNLLNYDVIITSYSNIHSDLAMLNMINWEIVVLDEAQNIKNPYAKRSKDTKNIKRKIGIAVTGTPFENHMTDLWSIVDYIMPGYCGSLTQYEKMFDDSFESAEQIEKFLTPIMIRRKVKDVAKDLPERIDIPHPIEMTEKEASYYEQGRKDLSGLEKMKLFSIETIQKLRMFCTHPFVYGSDLDSTNPVETSNKYSLLCDLVEEIVLSSEKVIIFTSYNKMSSLMYSDLSRRFGVYVNCINGSTDVEKRQDIIDEFSNIKGSAILILNPKAAGTGLNITSANHVIHYNLEWNPAIEDQASARAYRRGQKRTVFIHRLFYVNTIDEVINDRIQFKRELSQIAIVGNQGTEQDKEDLLRALSLSPLGGNINGK